MELEEAYVSELLSYSLERLNKEPELLQGEADRIRRLKQDVAVSNYRAFITAADCTASVRKEVASVRDRLDELQKVLPGLTAGCRNFAAAAEKLTAERAQNRQLLQQHGMLVELLEVPQLMETCVRNGNYDEALDLEGQISKLVTQQPGVPLVGTLGENGRAVIRSMLVQLITKLRGSVQLPECLRVVGYLRRMAVFSEPELRMTFLRCREAFLVSVASELDPNSPYEYLKRLTDAHRVHLFDVVMQYRAIFADDTSAADAQADSGLIHAWAMHRLSKYLAVLRATLPKLTEGSAVASVLEHCTYCGSSLGRVGLDFRGILPQIFEGSIATLFALALATATESLEHSLEHHRWVALPASAAPPPFSKSAANGTEDEHAPPYSLMEHPPVAVFTNGILASLNELRHCALASLQQPLAMELHRALSLAGSTLIRYHSMRSVSLTESQMAQFAALATAFTDVAVPYLVGCFSRIYSEAGRAVDTGKAVAPVRDMLARIGPLSRHGTGAAPLAAAPQVAQVAQAVPAVDGTGAAAAPVGSGLTTMAADSAAAASWV